METITTIQDETWSTQTSKQFSKQLLDYCETEKLKIDGLEN